MIESFQNKELRKFYEKGVRSGLNQSHIARIRRILTQLEAAHELKDLEEPAFGLHPLHGNLKGFWAKEVSGNWRIIFRFENGKAYDIDYLDYH
ncbi:MAG: type II toxin-antitoxin system RelE/ParE family toxin [Bacteroidota bacterium]|jgi:proteic killer suppression protein|nr:type II toxin-antitoxin system RelE/ParE family toxin [Cytophagales bacterium]MCE2958861.1 type II toxin-antitoxin system RelE/ParE family toxin [Flammeovirgaceae bacterium]MCZ8071504.1 type II toxin-antitoxin system RelE/ParE family toxin [Cytophagales bacterium]